MSWKFITNNVLVPLMRCWPSSFLHIPEQSLPISLAKDQSHFLAYCGWRRSCAHILYSPVSLLSNKHAIACCAIMSDASAIVCKYVRDVIGLVVVCDGLALLALVPCDTGSCICCRSLRSPLVMVPCGATLVIVPSWAPLEVTVGAVRSWCVIMFDCWMLCGFPCGFFWNCSLVDYRGGISFCCGVTRHELKIFLYFLNGCKLWCCTVDFYILDCTCEKMHNIYDAIFWC